jgi:hypothetical protein
MLKLMSDNVIHVVFPRISHTLKRLWSKYRIPYKKEAEALRKKMREWWSSYPWMYEPRPHKMICGVAVSLASPMGTILG